MNHIMFCKGCGTYTLKRQCNACSSRTVLPKPARYSPEDHYAAYRRKAKEEQLTGKGWL